MMYAIAASSRSREPAFRTDGGCRRTSNVFGRKWNEEQADGYAGFSCACRKPSRVDGQAAARGPWPSFPVLAVFDGVLALDNPCPRMGFRLERGRAPPSSRPGEVRPDAEVHSSSLWDGAGGGGAGALLARRSPPLARERFRAPPLIHPGRRPETVRTGPRRCSAPAGRDGGRRAA
jgi:hypothetical protein